MVHFISVGGNHTGDDWQPGGTTEFGHHLPIGETLFDTVRIFGIGQDTLQSLAQCDGLVQQSDAVQVDGGIRLRKTFSQRLRGVDLPLTGQYAVFQLRIFGIVAILGGFHQTRYRLATQRLSMT